MNDIPAYAVVSEVDGGSNSDPLYTSTPMMIQRKQVERRPERRLALLGLLLLYSCCCDWQSASPSASGSAQAFTPPLYGLAGLVNPVRNVQVTTASESNNIRAELAECADFFVDAFWSSKLQRLATAAAAAAATTNTGGTTAPQRRRQSGRQGQQHDDDATMLQLRQQQQQQQQQQQRNSLYQQQWAEFTKRYGNVRRNSELVVLKKKKNKKNTNDGDNDDDDEILGIVGVEVERIQFDADTNFHFDQTVPLMSNLAIAKTYRRRGLAERLVQAAERIVRDGVLNCDNENLYLYVEQKNRPAVQLYKKMGYTVVWKNPNAISAVPTSDGSGWQTTTTTVLCMRKRLVPSKKKWFGFP